MRRPVDVELRFRGFFPFPPPPPPPVSSSSSSSSPPSSSSSSGSPRFCPVIEWNLGADVDASWDEVKDGEGDGRALSRRDCSNAGTNDWIDGGGAMGTRGESLDEGGGGSRDRGLREEAEVAHSAAPRSIPFNSGRVRR